jgi:hypothetical protein
MWKKLVAIFALLLVVGGEIALAEPSLVPDSTTVAAIPSAHPAAQPRHRRTRRHTGRRRHNRRRR